MNTMTIAQFDHLPLDRKRELLFQCCGSTGWVNKMIPVFPVEDLVDLLECAEEKWYECSEEDWLEAFEHHPKIGDINSLKERFANTKEWAEGEQAAVKQTSKEVLKELSEYNKTYEEKFGFIFIICATGRSAEEMLVFLKERLHNSKAEEIAIAAREQLKIFQLRLEKLFV
jgi:2-oxo-4-hydroxy-4-carboxy-5-ureidoimidazoline decarboxylase